MRMTVFEVYHYLDALPTRFTELAGVETPKLYRTPQKSVIAGPSTLAVGLSLFFFCSDLLLLGSITPTGATLVANLIMA